MVVSFIIFNEGHEYVGTKPIDKAGGTGDYSIRMSFITKRVETSPLVKRTSVDGDTAGELNECPVSGPESR